jgi:hypothetical protein
VVLSPRCGLAGESPEGALARLTALATEAGRFAEDVLA